MRYDLDGLTFCTQTFGCQMNKHDSERIVGMLESLGCAEVDSPDEADIVIFMTCCVRESADTRLFGHVMSLKDQPLRAASPLRKRIIAIGGCIGQRDGDALTAQMPHVQVVFGTNTIHALPHLLHEAMEGASASDIQEKSSLFSTDLPTHRKSSWAAWLPITVGCDNFCTYCIVPHVRGRERSRALEDVADEARRYVREGVREITLLGQNVNSYGRDLYGSPRFADMLDAIDATGVDRLRFATSHPKDLSPEVIARFGSLRSLMPALHLPVQSGSDRILEMMNRRYTREHYRELIASLRRACPGIALSTDVIVGFPGETEEDFQQTLDLIDEVGYHQVFTFIYSKRAGTPAASFEDEIPREVAQERFDRLLAVVETRALEANLADVGSTVDVLIEGTSKKDARALTAKTPKGQTVHIPLEEGSTNPVPGEIAPVRIEGAKTWYLTGKLLRS